MKTKIASLLFILTIFLLNPLAAQFTIGPTPDNSTVADSVKPKSRLTIGGYGEAVYKYNFYSDNMFRYSHAEKYADAKGHGRVDLPHAVFMMSYDFGKGWTFNTEIEFEHGGTESAVEVEAEETGEFEKEIERGGEVALEQFWLQKSFLDSKINIRLGHIIVPTVCTTAAHATSSKPSCGTATAKATPAGPSRNSATSAKRTAMPSFNSSTPFDDV